LAENNNFQPINYFLIFGDEKKARIKENKRLLHIIISLFPPDDIKNRPRMKFSPSLNTVRYPPPIAIITNI
jgi:hypothetical protein